MRTSNYSDEFKRDAVQQITARGVSGSGVYKEMKLFAEPASKASGVDHEAQNRRLTSLSGRIRPSSASGPCAGCSRFSSAASTHVLRSR